MTISRRDSMSDPASSSVAEAYSRLVAEGAIEDDREQRKLVARLDLLLTLLSRDQVSQKSSALGWLFNKRKRADGPDGLYIHGSVGRGKSMLMDLFFDRAPGSKRRVHFHEFMADAHERIARQRKDFAEGVTRERDPIKPVGRALAHEARLLCFDEFSITDIADAMIIGRLFAVLFQHGVTVVATSNVAPDDLYRDGLNRQLFLPFIDMLKANCEVFELDARADFRLEKIARGEAYLSPLGPRAEATMQRVWERLTANLEPCTAVLTVKGRQFSPKAAAGSCAWFTFDQLCREARGASDYLAIVHRFDTVLIEGVPMMDGTMRNEARRFVALVDTLYDQNTRAVFSAQANPHALYQGTSGNEAFEFRRTASRLIEMQSEEYLNAFNNLPRREGAAAEQLSTTDINRDLKSRHFLYRAARTPGHAVPEQEAFVEGTFAWLATRLRSSALA
jgi:cell division protein ZapE